jgi:hypothetical protein
MSFLNTILDFLKLVVVTTANQLISVLGIFFIFGFLLFYVSKFTRKVFVNSGNYKVDLYATAWIGTPVHEIGHAVFCVLFGHKIFEIKLFQPNSLDGTLGYVSHGSRNTLYNNIGQFFIGAGPIIFGSIILYALMYLLLPNGKQLSQEISSSGFSNLSVSNLLDNLSQIFSFSYNLIGGIFSAKNLSSIEFYIFMYISGCVASHMKLSPPDLQGMWSGLLTLCGLFLIFNFFCFLFGVDATVFVMQINKISGILIGLFIYSLVISFLVFITSYLIFSIQYYLKYKRRLSFV